MASNPTKPLTLADHALASGDPAYVKIVENIHKSGNVLQFFTFKKQNRLTKTSKTIDNADLPDLGFGQLNQEATDVKATDRSRAGWTHFVRHTLSADRMEIATWNETREGMGPWTRATKGLTTAWSKKFTYDLINGSVLSDGNPDSKGFYGIRNMMLTSDSRSTWHIADSCKVNGGGVGMNPLALSAASAQELEEKIDELLFEMDKPDGDGIVLLMPNLVAARLTSGNKLGSNFDTTQDSFGRKIMTFRNAKLLRTGYNKAGTPVLPTYETAAGVVGTSGTDKYASIFAIATSGDCMDNWMAGDLAPSDLPQNNVWEQKLVDAMFGFLPLDDFWAGQIYNIQVVD